MKPQVDISISVWTDEQRKNPALIHKCRVIESPYNVHNTLGCRLLEKVYENSLPKLKYEKFII